ncbi:MAG: S41 family peptidase [Bacillota bacterium]|nr:S41 family peptidase [Bacillota bacterium]
MWDKKKTITACCITFFVTVAITMGFMRIFNVGIGDKVFVSQTDYENMKAAAYRYSAVDKMYKFLEDNYYQDLDEEEMVTGLIKGLFAGTGDPYTRYMTEEEYADMEKSYSGEFEGVGVSMNVSDDGYIEVISVIDDSPASKAGIRDGDLIVAVDDVRYSGEQLSEAAAVMRGEKGTGVKLTVSRGGVLMDFNLVRAPISDISVSSGMLEGNIGYIRIASFNNNTAQQFKKELQSMENKKAAGLVIDLRSNGGGLVDQSVEIADMLMNEGTIVYMENGKGEKTYYTSEAGRTELEYAVLVNGGSASASEILVAGIQGNDEGTIIGTQTYGKGITQKTWKLAGGGGIEITVSQYFAPDGGVIHKKGITPDIVVDFEESDITEGVVTNDRQLQKAVEILSGGQQR